MKYCSECGNELVQKECGIDGLVPFCPKCREYRFPTFNSAISSVIFNPDKTKILLIQQYGNPFNILVAGYINKGENANEALHREIKEEVNLDIKSFSYNDNLYFEKSNTLIHNFISIAKNENFSFNDEVDSAAWFPIKDAIINVKPNSLAKNFLFKALHKMNMSEYLFIYEDFEISIPDHEGKKIAFIRFANDTLSTTYVDDSLRGLGIADKLMQATYTTLKEKNKKCRCVCSYAVKWLSRHPECEDIFYL